MDSAAETDIKTYMHLHIWFIKMWFRNFRTFDLSVQNSYKSKTGWLYQIILSIEEDMPQDTSQRSANGQCAHLYPSVLMGTDVPIRLSTS